MTDAPTSETDIAVPHRGRGCPKDETITLTKAARARFDTLAAGSIEAVFQAVLAAATQDGDMAAAKLLIDRVIPSRRGAPVSFHIRPLKAPEGCAPMPTCSTTLAPAASRRMRRRPFQPLSP